MVKSKFDIQSPSRVLKQAGQFKSTLNTTIPLPIDANKSMYVEKVADYDFNEIQYTINRAHYQNTLFRKLQKSDNNQRRKISQSLLLRDNKIQQNLQKNIEKQHKKHQLYSKHVKDVQKRYDQQQKKKFNNQKEEALKLRKELRQFYEQQQKRKKIAQQKQVSVKPLYSNALERIHRLQKKNQQFALKAQQQLQKSFIKNNPSKKMELLKLRSTSLDFKKNYQTYQNSMEILKMRESRFIQKYAQNQTTSIKAFEHIDEENQKVKKRIKQKLKKDTQKWAQQKKRINQKNEEVPEKCTQRMQKTLRSSFRNTFSTFKDSFSTWRQTGQLNRSKIKQKIDMRKQQIMEIHNDLTLRNKSTRQVDQKMLSMKQRAGKVAVEYL